MLDPKRSPHSRHVHDTLEDKSFLQLIWNAMSTCTGFYSVVNLKQNQQPLIDLVIGKKRIGLPNTFLIFIKRNQSQD